LLIGLSGFIGSGKDTVASYLEENHDYWKMAFADSLKDMTASLFGWDREIVEGATAQNRFLREKKDEYWSDALGREWSPRIALQFIGTEMFRENLHPDFWIMVMERRILSTKMRNIVISDVRFENEMEMIRRLGGQVWRITRKEVEPQWSKVYSHFERERFKNRMKLLCIHETEWNSVQPGIVYDKVLDNDLTLDVLYESVRESLGA
jgi:hypothetical protein